MPLTLFSGRVRVAPARSSHEQAPASVQSHDTMTPPGSQHPANSRRPNRRSRLVVPSLFAALAGAMLVLAGLGRAPGRPIVGEAELRSWVVAARGRHLYLDLVCRPPFRNLSGRIEFTTAALRRDYVPPRSARSAGPPLPPRVARMSRGAHLRPPPFSEPRDRLEYRYRVTLDQARELQRDRLFSAPYELLGPNSNAAMRAVLESAGLRLPRRVLDGAGVLGEFPGIDASVGPEIPPARWAEHGLPGGPAR